jgi:branched-chain amino acid transport system ATP-binding protein
MQAVLDISQLTMDFGGLRALDAVDLVVHTGEIVALIGPNGAGKTTLFNCITGIYVPTQGDIVLNSPTTEKAARLNGLKPDQVTAKGMARTFQNIRLFQNMTVLENVMIAPLPNAHRYPRRHPSPTAGACRRKTGCR